MFCEDRSHDWQQAVDNACRHLYLSPVSMLVVPAAAALAPHRDTIAVAAVAAVGRGAPPTERRCCTFMHTPQEEARRHKQQLLMRPPRDKSQFATVAEGVVSLGGGDTPLFGSLQRSVLTPSSSGLRATLQDASIQQLREFIATTKRDYISSGAWGVGRVTPLPASLAAVLHTPPPQAASSHIRAYSAHIKSITCHNYQPSRQAHRAGEG
jgi:hypothetical protein